MSKPRILIVEDSSSVRQWFTAVLAERAELSTARNGLEALNRIWAAWEKGEPFQAIFMDIIMPVMDGLSAVKEIRRLERERRSEGVRPCRICIISRLAKPEDILKAQYHCGADGYVTKPFAESTILQTISNLGVELPHQLRMRCSS